MPRARGRCSEARQPFSVRSSSLSGAFGITSMSLASTACAQPGSDCVSRAVADLEQALRRRAAAAREPVAAVLLARELDTELLEPRDRVGRFGGEDVDELRVRGLVRAAEDVGGVLLGRVVRPDGCLDAALCLRGVARLDRALSSRGRRARRRAERRRRQRGLRLRYRSRARRNDRLPARRQEYRLRAVKSNLPYSDSLSC